MKAARAAVEWEMKRKEKSSEWLDWFIAIACMATAIANGYMIWRQL